MWSNMLPKPSSNSVFSRAKSESNSFGGVAVLAVLSVTVLFLLLSTSGGRPFGDVGDSRSGLPIPKENVLEVSRRKPGLADVGGGTGISLKGLDPSPGMFLSDLVSTDEGFVEEVLRRAEDAALS